MTVGRKPKPTALKLVTGNPGKRALKYYGGAFVDELEDV
jgi:hypothetical protein